MRIANLLGGFSLAEADVLRKAVGKKDPELIRQELTRFGDRAAALGHDRRVIQDLAAQIETFGRYGFPKAHSVAYSIISFQTAWLKAHYPAEFMAATLSADMDNTDKVQLLVDDAAANGLEVLPPDVHAGDYRFMPVGEKAIRYGLGAIKGTGQAAIGHIVEARSNGGPFRDLFDFCHRMDKRIVNRRVVESLIRAGAFDCIDDHRARLLATVGMALDSAEQASRSAHQAGLFGEIADAAPVMAPEVPRWSDRERLQNEKLALGYYLSGHPFHAHAPELGAFIQTRLDQLTPQPQPVLLAGIVHSLRIQTTRRGRMAVILLDDGNARVELTVFNELFEQHRHWLKEDQLLIVDGKVAHDDFSGSLRISAEKIYDLQGARNRFAKAIRITCNGESSGDRLKEVLAPYRSGACPVSVLYANHGAACEINLGEAWRVNLHDDLIQSLSEWLKPENVRIVYQPQRGVQ